MDLGGQPTAGPAQILGVGMIDTCGVLVGADNRAVDHLDVSIFSVRNGSQDPIPDTGTSPSHKPGVAGRVRAVSLW